MKAKYFWLAPQHLIKYSIMQCYSAIIQMIRRNNISVILFLVLLSQSAAQSTQDMQECSCLNGGECSGSASQGYCVCGSNYIDKQCQTKAYELDQNEAVVNLTEEFSYYYLNFTRSTYYFVQFIFCPASFAQNTVFEIYMEIQGKDGSLEANPEKVHDFTPQTGQCRTVKFIFLVATIKYNGEYAKLILRLKSTTQTTSTINPTMQTISPNQQERTLTIQSKNELKVSVIKYEFYQMQSFQLGKFLFITTSISGFIFILAFLIGRRILRDRLSRRRLRTHEVQVDNDISHFDAIMPVFQFKANENFEEENDCMICLVSVKDLEVRLTPCRHYFHQECIDRWGKKKLICPACRSTLCQQNQTPKTGVDVNIPA